MAMKQTQTKLFDFSDVGLDFSPGSKNLFPDRFKKMLALGYNEQTVSSVAVTGNQVTFTYGVSHGYKSDRVLKIDTGPLASINSGEFWIDSVTTNTVTMTIDGAPTSIAGNFATKVASLGWELMYEQANIHIYQFKHIDNTDMYARLCFQTNLTARNVVSVCIGKTFDVVTGFITDEFSLAETRQIATPTTGTKWEFQLYPSDSDNNSTYSVGYPAYGKAMCIGSLYHMVLMTNLDSGQGRVNAIFPHSGVDYVSVDYPVLLAEDSGPSSSNTWNFNQNNTGRVFVGNIRCRLGVSSSGNFSDLLSTTEVPATSFLSSLVQPFNITTAIQLPVYEFSSSQKIGYAYGVYRCLYATSNRPSTDRAQSPAVLNGENAELIPTGNFGNDPYFYISAPLEEVILD